VKRETLRCATSGKGGTGLGTKIVKDVVDAHKRKIWVESEPGVGTTFHLRLPLDPAFLIRVGVSVPSTGHRLKSEG
jgi:signal transduction histidine kinase